MKSSSANHNKLLSILLVAAITCFIIAFSLLTAIQSSKEIATIDNSYKPSKATQSEVSFDMADLEKKRLAVFDMADLLKAQVVTESFSSESAAPRNEEVLATPPASNFLYTSEATADVITAEKALPEVIALPPTQEQEQEELQNDPQLESPQDNLAIDQPIRTLPSPAAAEQKQEQVARSVQELQKANIAVPQEKAEPKQQLASTGVAAPLLLLMIVIVAFAAMWLGRRYE